MSESSKIEWTDATWNPVRGCTKISPGCTHCYAETFAERFRGVPGHPFEFGFDLRLVPEKLGDPIRWPKPKKVFVNSMSDLFHEAVPDDYIQKVCRIMLSANWHTYQILTKRADRMADLLQVKLRDAAKASHIWWGVSVENRKHGLPRIAKLRAARPAVPFLSVEPLLEDLGKVDLRDIHWVIVGGESGPGARPMFPDWVRSIRSQCEAQSVAFFFKQWGGVRKSTTGRELDGRTDAEVAAQMQHREKQLRLVLDQTLARLTPPERAALDYAALLPPDSIPWPWLRALVEREHPDEFANRPGYPDPWPALRRRLEGLRLLTPGDHLKIARLHRMVAAHVREPMGERAHALHLHRFSIGSADGDRTQIRIPGTEGRKTKSDEGRRAFG